MLPQVFLILVLLQGSSPVGPLLQRAKQDFESGRYSAARVELLKALKVAPEDPTLWSYLGLTDYKLNDKASALIDFEKASTLDPRSALNYFNLGMLYHQQGETARALENYQRGLALLPIGTYAITFSRAGFQSYKQTDIVLAADQTATINATLAVGQVTQTVDVAANAEMLQTSSASLGQLISRQAVVDLPLNGRNPASLVLLSPGVIDVLITGAGVNQGYVANPNDTGASAAGGWQGSTYYMLDGSNSMDAENLLASPFPNPDAT